MTSIIHSSNDVQARTQEAPPDGTIGLNLRVSGPRSVDVAWNKVAVPNGDLTYDVYVEGLYYVNPGRTISIGQTGWGFGKS